MSHRTRAQERMDEIDISPTKLLADIEKLTGELEASQAKSEEYLAGLQRERAEFANHVAQRPRFTDSNPGKEVPNCLLSDGIETMLFLKHFNPQQILICGHVGIHIKAKQSKV